MLILVDINEEDKTIDRVYYLKKGGIHYLNKRIACEKKIGELVEEITKEKCDNELFLDL